VGWEAGYSDSYEPVKEKYAWVVYLAPEAVYVALQSSQAIYSGVDVNMGFKYFYGFLRAPGGASTIKADYIDSLWSVSFSTGAMELQMPPGPMSHLSMGLEVEMGFFRVENTRQILSGIQWGAGFSAAYSLLPIQFPVTVELDREWVAPPAKIPFSGFWPVAIWHRTVSPSEHPIDQVLSALRDWSTDAAASATAAAMAGSLAPVLDRLTADADLRDFISNPQGSSATRRAIDATETWLQTGNTSQIPASLKPPVPYSEMNTTVKPILGAVQLAFETGYRVGAQSNPNNRTVYVDGIITNYCQVGERCTVEVPVQELKDLIPGRTDAEFEGAWISFDVPLEYFISYDKVGSVEWVQITNGVARYTLAQSLSTPQLVGVRFDDDPDQPLNNGRDIELKRRLVIFVDAIDVDSNGIPDFWEDQFDLTDRMAGADADRDGVSDRDEYLAGTSPVDASQFLSVEIPSSSRNELVLSYTSSVRNYVIQANTNSIATADTWLNVMDFYGDDAEMRIDISGVTNAAKAFFRIKAGRP
jgi:hypothetical protein